MTDKIRKIKFNDLNNWLKFAIIGGFAYAIFFIIGFLIGVFEGYYYL